ncbi:MAG: NIF family HAD-type phosphatase [Janthinobacterium lividum]
MNDKILLILDLDETLLHASAEKLPQECDYQVFNYFIYKRPGLDTFLTTCARHFELAVWSSASNDYVSQVVSALFPPEIPLRFVWSRSRCTPFLLAVQDEHGFYNLDYSSSYEYAKRLKKVRRGGFTLQKMLIVDDTPAKVLHNYGNAIYIKPFYGDPADTELDKLGNYLLELKDVENVRTIEKRNWRHF